MIKELFKTTTHPKAYMVGSIINFSKQGIKNKTDFWRQVKGKNMVIQHFSLPHEQD